MRLLFQGIVCFCCLCLPLRAAVYDVYIMAGQSNMDGRGLNSQLTAPYNAPQSDVLIRYTNPDDDTLTPRYQTNWMTLRPGMSVAPGYTGSLPSPTFGTELSFGRSMADNTTERKIAIIKVALGGTNLHTQWDPSDGFNGDMGNLYKQFKTAVPAGIAALQALGNSVEIRGMIWHQGESDGSPPNDTAYQGNLTELINVVRFDLGYANLPFLIGELESNGGDRLEVRTAQANVAAAMPFVEFVPSTGLGVMSDGTHFTTASLITFGQRYATTMQSSISNIAGDFNRDGLVNQDDYLLWNSLQGSTIDARADGNNDGVVNNADFQIWAAAVPEPSFYAVTALGMLALGGCYLRRSGCA